MTDIPSQTDLRQALADAGSAHHDYEQVVLGGVHDKLWSGFYAAFALGRLGGFASASDVARWLEEAPSSDDWAASAAVFVLDQLDRFLAIRAS
jgi:hypothetical protein